VDLSGVWANATDLNGTARPQGGTWDIGAYEYTTTQLRTSNFEFRTLTTSPQLAYPNPIKAALLKQYLLKNMDLKVYGLAGNLLNRESVSEGICLLRLGTNPGMYKVAVIK
jgi:hypothetical protein